MLLPLWDLEQKIGVAGGARWAERGLLHYHDEGVLNHGCHLAFSKAKSAKVRLLCHCLTEINWFGILSFFYPFLNVEEKSTFEACFGENRSKILNIL